ncbi:hypothetical protein STEG23_019906 [Scotinomys teguina]
MMSESVLVTQTGSSIGRVRQRTSKANICGISGAADNMQILTCPGRSCCVLAILLATVNFQHGGGIRVTSSASQKGGRLDFTCTLWHKEDEAEGLMLFWCKDRSWDCSPETSLEQLRVKRDPGTDGSSEQSSQLVFTVEQATPSDSGTYQCCARSQRPEIHIHGHFFSVLVTVMRAYQTHISGQSLFDFERITPCHKQNKGQTICNSRDYTKEKTERDNWVDMWQAIEIDTYPVIFDTDQMWKLRFMDTKTQG